MLIVYNMGATNIAAIVSPECWGLWAMQIETILCPEYVEAKLEAKHNVTCREARQALLGRSRIRFAEKGHTEGEDVYAGFGQADDRRPISGRVLHL